MGVVLQWSSNYPTTVDTVADNFPVLIDGTHDVMASHVNSLASAVVSLETVVEDVKNQSIDFVWQPTALEEVGNVYKTWGSLTTAILSSGFKPISVLVPEDVTITAGALVTLPDITFVGSYDTAAGSRPEILVEDGVTINLEGFFNCSGVNFLLDTGASTPFIISENAIVRAFDTNLSGDPGGDTLLFSDGNVIFEFFGHCVVDFLITNSGQVDSYLFGRVERGASTYLGSSGTVNDIVVNPFGLTAGEAPATNYTGTYNLSQNAPNNLLIGSLGQDLDVNAFAFTNRKNKQVSTSSDTTLFAALADHWIVCDTDTAGTDIDIELSAAQALSGYTFFIRCDGTAGDVIFTLDGVTLIGDTSLTTVTDGDIAAVYFESDTTAKLMGELTAP